MVSAYIRYSTDKQTNEQQLEKIRQYCERFNMTINNTVSDEETSGTVSYRNRNLFDLIDRMRPGDKIIVSEQSRLSRSIFDFNDILRHIVLEKKGVIILCDVNKIYDATNMDTMAQIELSLLTGFSQMERENISNRTKAALDARKRSGGWISKSGVWRTSLGGYRGGSTEMASAALAAKRAKEITESKYHTTIFNHVKKMRLNGDKWVDIANALNKMGILTPLNNKWCGSYLSQHYKRLERVLL